VGKEPESEEGRSTDPSGEPGSGLGERKEEEKKEKRRKRKKKEGEGRGHQQMRLELPRVVRLGAHRAAAPGL
jgi:hypothetical protein